MSNDTHTLSGAYALDALGPEEAAAFREHLQVCQACRDEVRELREAATRMGQLEAVAPPPELKRRVLAAVDRTPQQPPASPSAPEVPTPITLPTRSTGPGGADPGPRRWLPRLAAAAAAVVLVGGGALGVASLRGGGEPPLAAPVARVFDASDARTVTVETANGGKLTVAVSRDRNEMAVDTRGLPKLDSAHVYQIWSVHDGAMASAAVLADTDEGAAMGIPGAETQVALTVEPKGGSKEPTTDPIVVVDPGAV